jgi:hypothetical protein
MSFFFGRVWWMPFIFWFVLAMLPAGFARERGPRVEVFCPSSPIAVRVADHKVLAYELHITNFDAVPLTLTRLEVFADAEKNQPLKIISGDTIPTVMAEAGSMGGDKDSQIIGPAKRAVIFLWIELALDAPTPTTLKHRIAFTSPTAQSVLENLSVAVSPETPIAIGLPFVSGVWLAGDGPGNDSNHRRSIVAIDGRVHDSQRFASDWVKVGPNGDSHHDGTSSNENYWAFGVPLLAVADGEVTGVLDGIPENTPRVLPKEITLDNIVGNFVTLRIAPNRYATYAHLQNGSVKVRLHDHVSRGTVIGRLGNTGQATAPHLHFQVTDGNSVLQSEGVPFIFSSFTDLGPGSVYELDKHASIPRSDSIPGQDEVVDFSPVKK